MEHKNTILREYCGALNIMGADLQDTLTSLGDNVEINKALISTAYVQVEAIKSQLLLLTQALDNYGV